MNPSNLYRSFLSFQLVLAAALFLSTPQTGAAEQPFYAGKTVTIMAGFSPGGTIDLRARLFARYLVKYIPGNPSVVVQNKTGAGGLVAANYVFGVNTTSGKYLFSGSDPIAG